MPEPARSWRGASLGAVGLRCGPEGRAALGKRRSGRGSSPRDSRPVEVAWGLVEGGHAKPHAGLDNPAVQRPMGSLPDLAPTAFSHTRVHREGRKPQDGVEHQLRGGVSIGADGPSGPGRVLCRVLGPANPWPQVPGGFPAGRVASSTSGPAGISERAGPLPIPT